MNMINKKPISQYICEVDRETYEASSDKGFKCQFEGLYGHIREEQYEDFYEDFFEYEGKHYCIFYAPMEAKKALGSQIGRTKKEILKKLDSDFDGDDLTAIIKSLVVNNAEFK